MVYNATKHLAEVLSSVPECEKAAMCLAEEGHVFDKLRSGTCIVPLTMSSVLRNRESGTSRSAKRKFTKTYAKQLHRSDQRRKGT